MSSKKTLKNYCDVLYNLKEILQIEITLAVTDLEKIIMYRPGDILKFPLQSGMKIPENDTNIQTTLKTQKPTVVPYIPSDLYGIPFRGWSIPINDKTGTMIGVIALATSLEKEDNIRQELDKIVSRIFESTSKFGQASDDVKYISSQLEEISATTEELYARIEEISSSAETVYNASHVAKEKSDAIKMLSTTGSSDLNKVTKSIGDVSKTSSHIEKQIHELRQSMSKINDMVNLISGLSDQTNLLALNASIEAARAGEHGRGFAVVADEVSKLADQSLQATKDITSIVKTIETDIDKVVASVNDSNDLVRISVESTEQTSENMLKILQGIDDVVGLIGEANTKANSQQSMTQEITEAVENLATASQSAAGNAQNVTKFILEESKEMSSVKDEVVISRNKILEV